MQRYSGRASRSRPTRATGGAAGRVVRHLAGRVRRGRRRAPPGRGVRGAPDPDSFFSTQDLVLATVAAHKVSRLLAKDPVPSPFRVPFTSFKGADGEAELAEEVRGHGPRKAVGELVTCPFCLGQWVATGFMFGFVLAPRQTRLAASIFTVLTGADALQLVYAKAQTWAT